MGSEEEDSKFDSQAQLSSAAVSVESVETSNSSHDVFFLSDDIINEEAELHKATVAKVEETERLNEERLRMLEKDGCYERLKFLLTNCVHYTSHLHRRMEEQREELVKAIEKQRAINTEKSQEKKIKAAMSRGKRKKVDVREKLTSRQSPRFALQEAGQRSNMPLQITSPISSNTDQNNNTNTKKRGRPQETTLGEADSHNEADVHHVEKRIKLSNNTNTDDTSPEQIHHLNSETEKADTVGQNADAMKSNRPILFTGGDLRTYQVDGYKWLQMLYENAINGILADEMGLGKTVQCIALICELVANGLEGPFFICGPLSTVPNWVAEFARFSPKVPVILYHGSKPDRMHLLQKIKQQHIIEEGFKVSVHPVVITSYEIAMNDRQLLSNFSWKLLIVDEGHRIKNSCCRLVKELKLYNSAHRLLLTGTPLQNNMAELWSLLNFLIPEIFDNLGSFETWFDAEFLQTVDNAHEQIIQEEQRKHTLSMLHQILQPFVLRRLKSDIDIIIPPKRELLVYARLVPKQQEMYHAIVDKTIRRLVEGPPLEEEILDVELDKKGRPIRQVRKNAANLKFIFENVDKDDSSTPRLKHHRTNNRRGVEDNEDEDEDIERKEIVRYHKLMVDSKNCGGEAESKGRVSIQLRNLMFLLRRCCNHPYLIEYPMVNGELKLDEDIVMSSGKLMLLDRMLTELIRNDHKVLIFSQMTMVLDILEDYLTLRNYCYSRLDGSMKMSDRQNEIKRFAEDDVRVFLLSTRAGGLGINLTQADTVIIYDSDWNPQCDLQAQDRCHRIGQTRPVMVYRLVTVNTVDQKIVERATAKRKLEKLVMHKGKFKSCKAMQTELLPMNPQDLLEVLKETDYTVATTSESIISADDLKQLLDRSDLQRLWNDRLEGKSVAETNDASLDQEVKGVFKVIKDSWDELSVQAVAVSSTSL